MEGQRILNEVSVARLEPPVPPMPPEPQKTPLAPPIPPSTVKPILLVDKWREAAAEAKDGDALDAAWRNVVEPHMQGIDREIYEALMAIDDARRNELETM
jgi:hypothetical protein